MNRMPALAVTLVVLASATMAGAAIAAHSGPPLQTDNATRAEPGPSVAGVIGVQGATLDRSIAVEDIRTRLDSAETPSERAEVLADALDRADGRLGPLESRLQTLQTARANGSMSEATYARRVAPVVASARSLDAVVEQVDDAAAGMNPETRRSAGVTTDRIAPLQSRIDQVVAADEGAVPIGSLDQAFFDRIATVATAYNGKAGSIDLGMLGSMASEERINLHIDRTDGGTSVVSFRTTGATRVHDLRAGPRPDATMRIRIDETTARRLLNTDDRGSAVSQAVTSGAITVDGLGTYNAVRWTIASTVIGLIGAVADLFNWLLSILPW